MQEKTLTGGRSYYLDIARAIAIISISLNHAVNRTYENYAGQMEEFLELSWASSLLKAVTTMFSHLGVPLFLMISGALLLLSAIPVQHPRRSDGGLRAPRHPAVCHGLAGAAAPWSGASSGPSAGGDLSGQDILWRLLYPHPGHVAVGVEHEL